MQKHTESHPFKGAKVILNNNAVDNHRGLVVPGEELIIEDWWDVLTGGSWMFADGNPAAIMYGMRNGFSGGVLPVDDEVVYGKIGAFGHLVHVSEFDEPAGKGD